VRLPGGLRGGDHLVARRARGDGQRAGHRSERALTRRVSPGHRLCRWWVGRWLGTTEAGLEAPHETLKQQGQHTTEELRIMTETSAARSRSRRGGKGLKIERIYTTPGVHPYDEVTWEKRDVVQQNWKTGATIFDQRGVEFPDFWSANASTIVTTKYFRGALGTEARETGLKQLVDRVVLTYVKAGKEHGYFATD